MVLHQKSLTLITIITILITTTSIATIARAQNSSSCSTTCGSGKSAKSVQYPFGFSEECVIPLTCSDKNEIKFGEFTVQNVTRSSIFVHLPAQCNRRYQSIDPLFGPNFGPSLNNNLLFQNCTSPLPGCQIPAEFVQKRFNLSSCDNITKYLLPKKRGVAIAAIIVAVIAGVLIVGGGAYFGYYRKNKVDAKLPLATSDDQSSQTWRYKPEESNGAGRGPTGISVDKSVEFSYEELSRATDNFSLANKIGQGGFGAVYYAELRGEKAAIKKMDMRASKEFLAELNVLTRVHHLNLVRLIGYCVEGSLFLVYEYIESGNLSQHLRGSGRDPLPWSNRVQIALDSARGLEYIHEYTVPAYIHRDIKSANILIDKNFHAKVADFGLAKLTEVGSASLPTRLVGTFGYLSPEYAQYGKVSPKVDVYAFGVVIYELISAKEAVVRADSSGSESRGLVGLFEEVLNQPDPKEDLRKLVDPGLGDNYPLDSVRKMAQLAKACTHENKDMRPSMGSIVVALMTLWSI